MVHRSIEEILTNYIHNTKYLAEDDINHQIWQAYLPDLNPIEHAWSESEIAK